MKGAHKNWWKGAGTMRKDGSRMSWEPYSVVAWGELREGEVLTMDDGCTVQRRGDWLRWVEPAELVRSAREREEAKRAKASAELEAAAGA